MRRRVFVIVRLFCVWAVLCAVAGVSPARAAQAPGQAPGPGQGLGPGPGQGPGPGRGQGLGRGLRGGPGTPTPAELQDLFDSYVIAQIKGQLHVTDDQLPQVILRVKELQAARRRGERARLRIIQELRGMLQATDGKVDESQVRDRLRTLDDVDEKTALEVKQALGNLDQVLDVGQQARLRILEEQIERNKVQLLMRARQRANAPGRQ